MSRRQRGSTERVRRGSCEPGPRGLVGHHEHLGFDSETGALWRVLSTGVRASGLPLEGLGEECAWRKGRGGEDGDRVWLQ